MVLVALAAWKRLQTEEKCLYMVIVVEERECGESPKETN